jgi:hypothetical protein
MDAMLLLDLGRGQEAEAVVPVELVAMDSQASTRARPAFSGIPMTCLLKSVP